LLALRERPVPGTGGKCNETIAACARYTATVTVAGPNDTQTKTWHFTTA
jgi:hypothetical protein